MLTMPAKRMPYVNKFTGEVLVITKQHAKKLSEDWSRVRFVKNQEGEQVMRLELNGATVDVSENGEQEVELDGIGNPK